MRTILVLFCFVAASCTPPLEQRSASAAEDIILIVGGTVINPNKMPIANSLIVIKKDKILYAGPHNPRLYRKYKNLAGIINAQGKFIIPGLIDMHVHYEPWMGRLFLAKGVTTVKDTGNNPARILKERARVQASPSTPAPRIFACGPVVDGKHAVWDMYSSHIEKAGDREKAQKIVTKLVAKGVDCIKTYINLSRSALRGVITEARRHGRSVTGHLGRVHALEAARIGIDEIEHVSGVAEACLTKEARQKVVNNRDKHNSPTGENWPVQPWDFVDPQCIGSLIRVLVNHDVAINPTLVVYDRIAHLNDPGIKNSPRLQYVPRSKDLSYLWIANNYFAIFGTKRWEAKEYSRAQKQQQARMKFIRTFMQSGGLVVSGSDTPNPYVVPGFGLHRELELLTKAGLMPNDALQAATINAAKLLGKESRLGSVDVGKYADVVILNENPLKDISHVENIHVVFRKGIQFMPSELLEQARLPKSASMQAQ